MRLWLLAENASGGFVSGLKAWMEGFAGSPLSTVWLFVFAFAESSFFPIPPDILLIALCLTDSALGSFALAMWFAAVCTAGSTFGGAFGYEVGRYAGRPVLRRLVRPERVRAAERLLQRYDVWAVVAAGFTPIPYKVFTIASGMLNVRFVRFMVASVASRGARFFLVAAACHAVGRPVRDVLDRHLGWASLVFFVMLVGGFYALRALGRRLGTEAQEEGDSQEDCGP